MEREYRQIMARVVVMLSNGAKDAAADAEVGTAFGSAATAPLVRPLGVTLQMESEWDEVEDERPPSMARVSVIDIRSSPAVARPSTTVCDMTNLKNIWRSVFSRSLRVRWRLFGLRILHKEKEKKLRHELEEEVCGRDGDRSAIKDVAKTWKGGIFTRADSASK